MLSGPKNNPPDMRNDKNVFDFSLKPGQMLSRYYEVVEMLGSGWEGEVYLVRRDQAVLEVREVLT